jgi:hypothetical protein
MRQHNVGTIEQQRIEQLKDIEQECNSLLTQTLSKDDRAITESTRNHAIALRLQLELKEVNRPRVF